MKAVFTSVSTTQAAFVAGQGVYHYGAWNRFQPSGAPDDPTPPCLIGNSKHRPAFASLQPGPFSRA